MSVHGAALIYKDFDHTTQLETRHTIFFDDALDDSAQDYWCVFAAIDRVFTFQNPRALPQPNVKQKGKRPEAPHLHVCTRAPEVWRNAGKWPQKTCLPTMYTVKHCLFACF
jgi:hypothetical protein